MSRSAEVPVIAVVCDDPAHPEPFVVARFGKPPAGNWIQFGAVTGEDWLPLPVFYDASVNPERQHLSRSGLNTTDTEHGVRYRLQCRKHKVTDPHTGAVSFGRTVPIKQARLTVEFDALHAAGNIAVSLSDLAANVRR